MKERDYEFWMNVEKYEKLCTLRREIAMEIDGVKKTLFKGLVDQEDPTRTCERWKGNVRVRSKETSGVTFSVTRLRDKFGDEWVQENSERTRSGTIEVKRLSKNGPRKAQF